MPHDGNRGVYVDNSHSGRDGRPKYRADVIVRGIRMRKRFDTREEAQAWSRKVRGLPPTDKVFYGKRSTFDRIFLPDPDRLA